MSKFQKIIYIINKYKLNYEVLDLIPINDLDAYKMFPKYNWVYNKLLIAKLQHFDCAPMPIEPEKFPVVLKPIINLYGMGLNSYLINSKTEFYDKYWFNNGFWTQKFEGNHYSFDCLINNGNIIWNTCFIGYKDQKLFGTFKYWESINKSLPKSIKMIVSKLDNYRGIINIECIEDNIIEIHLRMGDIDQFIEYEILYNIIQTYLGSNKMKKISEKLIKIFIFPIFIVEDKLKLYKNNPITEKEIKNACIGSTVHAYKIDDLTCAHSPGQIRIINLTSTTYESGIEVKNRIINLRSNEPIKMIY